MTSKVSELSDLSGSQDNETANHLELARKHLRKAATSQAATAPYLFALARAEFMAGELEAAQEACLKNIELDAAGYDTLLLLAEIQLRLKNPRESWKTATQAIKLQKRREEGWLLAARSAMQAGENQKAVECLELYLKVNKDQLIGPLVYVLLARVYLESGQPQQALEQLEQAQARLKALFTAPGPHFMALRARILRGLNRHQEGLDYYQQAIQMTPEEPALHSEMGETLLEIEKPEEALRSFREALQLAPSNSEYYCNAGRAALKGAQIPGQFSKRAESYRQQAVELLGKATQLNPIVARYWYELGQAYSATHNYKQMKQALQNAIAQSAAFADNEAPQVQYLRLYATACQKLGDFDGAHDALKQVLSIAPEDHETFNAIGELSYRQGRFGKAFNNFRKAETLDYDNPRYLANMSRVLMRMERLEEARELIEEAAKTQSGNYFVRHQLGAVLLESGSPEMAVEHLREAASMEPDNAEFRYYLGRAHLQLGQVSEAIQEYQEAVANAPLQHTWHAELGEIYLREKLFLPALESLRLASQLAPEEANYRYNLAIALAANGDVLGAIQTMRQAMETQDNNVGADWHYLLGRLLIELGRMDDALDSFAQAHEMEPANPHYKVDFAKVLRLKGEPIEQVKALLEEAIAEDPHSLRSYDELAYAYEAEQDTEAAIRTLESRINEVLVTVRSV
ncbi:MAG TPA: tetratricopeptide repeat protein [Chloroflexia bacterium]|nr:tetratricopeptide repeat protein [Chloroflexia bacterium]